MVQFSKQFVKLLLIWRWVVFALLATNILGHASGSGDSTQNGEVMVVVAAGVIYSLTTAMAFFFDSPIKGFVAGTLELGLACYAASQGKSEIIWLMFTLPPMEFSLGNFYAGMAGALVSIVLYPIMSAQVAAAGDPFTRTEALVNAAIMVLVGLVTWTHELLMKEERQTTALVKVIESSQELGTSNSLENLLGLMVQEVQNLFHCQTVVCFLKDPDPSANTINVAKKTSPNPDAFNDFDPHVTPSIVWTAMTEKKGIVIPDFQATTEADAIQKSKESRGTMVCPLLFEGNALGALFISSHSPGYFDTASFRLFQMLANQVAVAVRNIQLQQTTALMAITDSLSGLFTHGYFQDALGKEMIKAKYGNQPLALMILDVDFFKKVNDTYGHPQGDSLLKQLGAVIKQATRPQDVICRYGGDEFTATMLNTNRISAVVVAERIRQMVEEYEFVLDGKIVHITISGGVASLPEDAATKKELVEAADHAMYEAKSKGRNRICFGS